MIAFKNFLIQTQFLQKKCIIKLFLLYNNNKSIILEFIIYHEMHFLSKNFHTLA